MQQANSTAIPFPDIFTLAPWDDQTCHEAGKIKLFIQAKMQFM